MCNFVLNTIKPVICEKLFSNVVKLCVCVCVYVYACTLHSLSFQTAIQKAIGSFDLFYPVFLN